VRPVTKGAEPPALTAWWKQVAAGHAPGWEEIPSATKRAVKEALLQEQGFICCYCERRIDAGSSHIEHLQPQSVAPALIFAYTNLLASCQGEGVLGKAASTCGQVRGSQALPVHPLMPDCGEYFVFRASGAIEAAPSRGAVALQAIKALALDHPRLNLLRREVIAIIDDQLPDPDDPDAVRAAVQELLALYRQRDASGRLTPFLSAVEQHLKRY
jgi:uncharacterized protein (TIGR02646 family)